MQKPVPPEEYTEEYFLSVCDGFREFSEFLGKKLPKRLATAYKIAKVRKGQAILDVGCGRGELIIYSAAKGAKAVGIDYSEAAIKLSKKLIEKNKSKASVILNQCEQLPFRDESFDVIFMTDVVEHLWPNELDETLSEVYRVLKPRGKLIISTSPNSLLSQPMYKIIGLFGMKRGDVNKHVHVNEQNYFSMRKTLKKKFDLEFFYEYDENWFKNTHAYSTHRKYLKPLIEFICSKPIRSLVLGTPLKIFVGTSFFVRAVKKEGR